MSSFVLRHRWTIGLSDTTCCGICEDAYILKYVYVYVRTFLRVHSKSTQICSREKKRKTWFKGWTCALLERIEHVSLVRPRSVSPNVATHSSMKGVKFSKRGDEVSTKGTNHACVGPERMMPTRPIQEKSLAYRWGYNRMISWIWFMKAWRYTLVSLNFSCRMTVGLRTWSG